MRLLCLHGVDQSGNWLKEHLGQGGLLDALHVRGVELFFAESASLKRHRGWWRRKEGRSGVTYAGWEDCLAQMCSIFTTKGPFDGVLGLSQGACLAGLLCGICATGEIPEIDFRFAVLCSGHRSHDLRHAHLYQRKQARLECVVCALTLTQGKEAVTCTRCEAVSYCSRVCARRHWGVGGHSQHCKALLEARQKQDASEASKLDIRTAHVFSTVDLIVPPQQRLVHEFCGSEKKMMSLQ